MQLLHERLKIDYTARWELDCYLLAEHFYPGGKAPSWMVLDITDTYHYHNLPDLMQTIRGVLMGLCCCAWLQKLFNTFLCGKRYRRLPNTSTGGCQLKVAVLNTLHGLLLGLYPFNERRSDFDKRAWIAGQMHTLLTSPGDSQMNFIYDHQNILCLSLIEYILNAVHDFCPVEWAIIGISTCSKSQCHAAIEAFRENTVNAHAGTATFWTEMEAAAAPVVAAMGKHFKDATLYQPRPAHHHHPDIRRHISLALNTRIIHNSCSLFGQLRCALRNIQFQESEALEEIWTTIYMRRLPAHTTLRQIETLEKQGRMCHLVEDELHHIPVCLACAFTRRADIFKAQFRYDTVYKRLTCNECLTHEHVVNINMLGRALFIKDKVLTLCEKCLKPNHWNTTCPCIHQDSIETCACCVCNNPNVTSSKEVLDIETMALRRIHFCYRHTLACVVNSSTIYDMRMLQIELRQKSHAYC